MYEKTKGYADMSGELFEIKVCSLLFLRGLRMTKTFYLASNMSEAGIFDDIVFMYKDASDSSNICFLQLKHKKVDGKRSTVSMRDILSVKGDFSLPKYCSSYNKLKNQFAVNGMNGQHLIFKENFDSCSFIIYTNACCHKVLPIRPRSQAFGPKDILNSGGDVFSFTEYKKECVSNYFEDLPKFREFLCDLKRNLNRNSNLAEKIANFCENVSTELRAQLLRLKNKVTLDELDRMINDVDNLGDYSDHQSFLSRLYMFTSQKSEKELDQLIRFEIKEMFGVTADDDDDTTTIFRQLIEYIQLWWKYESFYLSETASFWQNLLQTRVNQINDPTRLKLQKYGVKFSAASLKKLQSAVANSNFLNIVTDNEIVILSFLKTYQALEDRSVMCILVDENTLIRGRVKATDEIF